MPNPRQAREMGSVLAELAAIINAECARPVSAGYGASGTDFAVTVFVGDEFINSNNRPRNQTAGSVVLRVNEEASFQPGKSNPTPVLIACRISPVCEAHIWTPATRQDRDDPLSGAQRVDAHMAMVECIVRALFTEHHGSTMPDAPPAQTISLNTDVKELRHGQASVLSFPLSLVIVEGQPLEILPDGWSIGTVGIAGTLNVNPEP